MDHRYASYIHSPSLRATKNHARRGSLRKHPLVIFLSLKPGSSQQSNIVQGGICVVWLAYTDAYIFRTRVLMAQTVKNLPPIQETWVWPLCQEGPPKEGNGNPQPGEFHGQRSLVGFSPWGHKELDTTEWLTVKKFDLTVDSLFLFHISTPTGRKVNQVWDNLIKNCG